MLARHNQLGANLLAMEDLYETSQDRFHLIDLSLLTGNDLTAKFLDLRKHFAPIVRDLLRTRQPAALESRRMTSRHRHDTPRLSSRLAYNAIAKDINSAG